MRPYPAAAAPGEKARQTSSAFAIPEGLDAKSAPEWIADYERHFAEISATLGVIITELAAAPDDAWPAMEPAAVFGGMWIVPTFLAMGPHWLATEQIRVLQRGQARA